MSKFEEIYKKVLAADKKFKELGIPINLDFKIEDFRDALIECNDKIEELKAENKRLKEIKDKYRICAEKAFDNIAKCELRIRRLSRSLWIARAERNKDLRTLGNMRRYVESLATKGRSVYGYPTNGFPANYLHKEMMATFETWCKNFRIAERKCREKAKLFE